MRNAWSEWLNKIEPPTAVRGVPKEWMYFHFLIQYLYDSKVNGCLPKGQVDFDHIVPFNKDVPSTRHPYNYCAVTQTINRKKRRKSYSAWNPTGSDKNNYNLFALNNQSVTDGVSVTGVEFLSNATLTDIETMIEKRRQVVESAIYKILPSWISDGDAT
jgi:hypothetical protein